MLGVDKKAILFSEFLSEENLNKVNYYSYFPVLEQRLGDITTCEILPSDDAIAYTLKFELKTKTILEGKKNWFNEPLVDMIDETRVVPVEKIIRMDFSKKKHSKCIIINLIDFCYGHSFVKMLNVEDFYTAYQNTHDIFVISFPDVEDYLPRDKFNSCLLQFTFSEIKKIYNFKSIIDQVKERYEQIDFPVLDAYLKIDDRKRKANFFNFFGTDENKYLTKKIVTFHYRSDYGRVWAEEKQKQYVVKLFTELKPYFKEDVLFCVLGDKDKNLFPDWILDKRIVKYPNPYVYEYSQIIASTVIMVSVTGSNMVVPSLLSSGMLVHFVKEPLLHLTATDVINYKHYANQTAYENIYLYEDGIKALDPKQTAFKILRLYEGKLAIEFREKFIDYLKNSKKIPTQAEYILASHSYFNYNKAKALHKKLNDDYWSTLKKKYVAKKIVNLIRQKLIKYM